MIIKLLFEAFNNLHLSLLGYAKLNLRRSQVYLINVIATHSLCGMTTEYIPEHRV